MPVFLISVNYWAQTGYRLPMPELIGVITSQPTAEDAVAYLLSNLDFDPRDIGVEEIACGNHYWVASGPEDAQ